jgi:hypothetical protein
LLTKYTSFYIPSSSCIKVALISVGKTAKYRYNTSPRIVSAQQRRARQVHLQMGKGFLAHSLVHLKAFLKIFEEREAFVSEPRNESGLGPLTFQSGVEAISLSSGIASPILLSSSQD